ncbi:MAG TPA: BadF/BadG/BcrA/BcrD ATPase family protein [Clostridia bacterium]|nr:BadF/BadG/BcrA/BcrD ATPase family protein [Clostridia bacterium]
MVGFVMGVDGGGTKTEYVIVDVETEERIGGGRLGALSPFAGEGQLEQTARQLATVIFRHELSCLAVRVGCAGAGEPEMKQKVRNALIEVGVACPVSVVGDHENALDTAFEDGDGAVLISGTGSVCCARCGGRFIRAGGRGHVFDDAGSGYAIGRDMLAAVARASDGRGPATKLTDIVRDFCGMSDIGDIATYYSDPSRPKGDIAALSQMLGMAVSAGDEAAHLIMEKAAADLAELSFAVLSQLRSDCARLALTGSVLVGNRSLRMRLKSLVAERFPLADCFVLYTRAAEGAAAYALKRLKAGD